MITDLYIDKFKFKVRTEVLKLIQQLKLPTLKCMVQEIPISTLRKVIGYSKGVGALRTKIFNRTYKANLEFPEG